MKGTNDTSRSFLNADAPANSRRAGDMPAVSGASSNESIIARIEWM